MATHANILACKIPLTEKPDEPWSMGLQRVRHDGVTKKVKVKVAQPCLTCCSPMDCSLPGSSVHGILQARILAWVSCSLLPGIFPIQESNPSLLHCRQILYHLSHQGSSIQEVQFLLILHTAVCVYQFRNPNLSLLHFLSPLVTVSLFPSYACESVST